MVTDTARCAWGEIIRWQLSPTSCYAPPMSSMRYSGLDLPHPPFLPSSSVPLLSGRWLIVGIAGAVVIDVLLLLSAHLRIDISWASIGFAAWGVASGAICYAFRARATPGQRIARDFTESVSLFAAISLLGAVASYPLASGDRSFVDPALERIDLSLHFHWIRWYELVATHAWLQSVERMAYLSIFFTPALLLGHFACSGRLAESRLFIATFGVAALITLALFPLLPAAGPFATLWHGAMPYMPLSALYQDQVILALRHHAIHAVDLGALHGLVCAPSFHAASAVLYMATAWRIAPLRWPIAALNVAMLLATPVEGTHYLADLLCGMIVASLALALTPVLIQSTKPHLVSRIVGRREAIAVAAE